MNDLRLIILVIGLFIIVFIYLWETAKQRRQNRRQTINYSSPDSDNHDLKITHDKITDLDYSSVLSDLNEALNKSRLREDEDISRILKSEIRADDSPGPAEDSITGDMFIAEDDDGTESRNKSFTGDYRDIGEDHIITLYVTARQGGLFSGEDIRDAAINNGLEFGELNIYHKFDSGDSRMDRPLYSVADMYEPGSFDPDNMGSRNTRGITLFMCLPGPVDGELAFELMLDSARELAENLGGEIRGPDRQLLTDAHLKSIHRTIAG